MGEDNQLTQVEKFGEGKFPALSSTLALGLGQNWTQTKFVIVVCAMDPEESNNMVGWVGRDGEEGFQYRWANQKFQKGKTWLMSLMWMLILIIKTKCMHFDWLKGVYELRTT